ncbi:MAG: CDP-archaeol synthase [Parachlamydiales bacterium]|nr:CDP-archaeol synthase [Parachlamydiales bacterium]
MNKLDDLKKRSYMSIASILIVFLLIYFSNILYVRPVVCIFVVIIAYFAANEYLAFAKIKNILIHKNLFLGGVVLEVVAFFLVSQFPVLSMLPLAIFFIFILLAFVSNFKKIENSFDNVAFSVFGFLYIAFPIAMILPIIYLSSSHTQDGRMWIFYLIFVTKITDIGAYFGGKLFGKKKLIEKISPKKTVFGSISGLVIALIGSIAFSFFSKESFFELSLANSIILGLVLSIVAQLGDLCESLLKRDVKVKNSSNLPGFGGILDMMDSLIFNIPLMYLFLLG